MIAEPNPATTTAINAMYIGFDVVPENAIVSAIFVRSVPSERILNSANIDAPWQERNATTDRMCARVQYSAMWPRAYRPARRPRERPGGQSSISPPPANTRPASTVRRVPQTSSTGTSSSRAAARQAAVSTGPSASGPRERIHMSR